MRQTNMSRRMKSKREKVLKYWKTQLNPATRSEKCTSALEYIKGQIEILEKRLENS